GFEESNKNDNNEVVFDHKSNAIIFDFASTVCSKNVKYRYLLSPIQKDWSSWEQKSQKEFNNLPFGKYALKVEASDIYGNTSPIYTYTFEILPPWYRTKAALSLYFLTGL